ncbi:DapH/DapD/GlmU-related protein [Maridesulfovibrio sp.]|uniref:acyltransferase n=1 Tax=Maridesulfovibrio sp. TaxID=2795000 RepID=UPI002AA8DFF2|nr:DapH/DapD/GlmU-related protein [Maridesulfovibrio sp.]
MDHKTKISLFQYYSWAYHLVYLLLEIMPPFIRNAAYKILLKNKGKRTLIDYQVYIRYPHKVHVGSDVELNRGCNFFPGLIAENSEIIIKNNVLVSPNVCFYSTGHDYTSSQKPDIGYRIVVHDNCWIGANSIILPGVEIGEGSVIGAGSVVTKDIAPNCIAFGNPATIYKKR